jgi:hypothetical protein
MSVAKVALATGAVAAGLGVGWAAAGRIAAVAVPTVLIAAANGYSKAHSP